MAAPPGATAAVLKGISLNVAQSKRLAAATNRSAIAPRDARCSSSAGEPLSKPHACASEYGRGCLRASWLNLIDTLSTGLPSTGTALGAEITGSLLRGWGADPAACAAARRRATALRTRRNTR